MDTMKCIIVAEDFNNIVKVWLFNDVPEGRVYMWPTGYQGSSKAMHWRQEIVPHDQAVPDTIRPALEMSRPIWDAFKEALLSDQHLRLDALDIVAKTLEREQNRVDALIHALIQSNEPQFLISKEPKYGAGT